MDHEEIGRKIRGNLTEKEWDEIVALEYVLTWRYSDDMERDEKRYKELSEMKDATSHRIPPELF